MTAAQRGERVLRTVADATQTSLVDRVRATATLLDLGGDGARHGWIDTAAAGDDRLATAHAAGALAVYGDRGDAARGVDAAWRVISQGIDDTPAVLCTRLVAARGTGAQARGALRAFADLPDPTVSRWELVASLAGPAAARPGLVRVRDSSSAAAHDRVRAAAALLADPMDRPPSAAVLAGIAADRGVDAIDRVAALDELIAAEVGGPWVDALVDIAHGCLAEDTTSALTAAEVVSAHRPRVAAEIQRAVATDPGAHPTARVRAAAVLLPMLDAPDLCAVHDSLAPLLDEPEHAPFDTVEVARLLAMAPDRRTARVAVDALHCIARDATVDLEDRYFAAVALFQSPGTTRAGEDLLVGMADRAGPQAALRIAGTLVARPVVHPALWSRI